jgi:hypothetical protein
MDLKAKIVLSDCKEAALALTDGLMGSAWRIKWVTCVALLRAVGHVLHNVDCDGNERLKDIVDRRFKDWKSTKIFRDFIDDERNGMLKEYNLKAGQNLTVDLNFSPPKGIISYSMNGGPFGGEDPRVVLKKAIEWQEKEIEAIERIYGNSGDHNT